jgi:hypothetical protein
VSLGYAAERAIKRFEFRYIEPLQFAARKRQRLEVFGLATSENLPCAELRLDTDPDICAPGCAEFVARERPQLAKFMFRPDGRAAGAGARPWRGVPCVIDLDQYPDFASYAAQLKRHSKGGILQQIKKARREGVRSKTIARVLYHRQCFEIEASKRFRSGPVLAALIRPPPASDFADGITITDVANYLGLPVAEVAQGIVMPEPPQPPCPHHWALDWGAFIDEPVEGRNGMVFPERLVAYVFAKRIGNLVRTRGVMGHGAYLNRNVVKLLFHDVVQWLLTREDPRVLGVRYLHYGAIEHGNPGLLAWKRSFGFTPMRFGWPPS